MSKVTGILSLLHEPIAGSATRLFRGQPVLRWTLQRLNRARQLGPLAILCWEDQLEAVRAIAEEQRATVLSKGPRIVLPDLQAITIAQDWADGWRGGLLSTCHFDLGFHAPFHHDLAMRMQADAVVLVDPSAALVDPELIDAMIVHSEAHPETEFCFTPTAPGLGAALLHTALLNRLAAARTHAGRLVHYHPDQLSRELLAADNCVPVPVSVARTPARFTLDSDRQVRRISAATLPLNGQLISSSAEELVRRVGSHRTPDALPREVVLELNTKRSTRPIYWAGRALTIDRPDFSLEHARHLFAELSLVDDTRLTLAGVGDPMLSAHVFTIIDAAKLEGRVSIHIETDLHDVSAEQISQLALAPVDVISIHLPALSPQTYAKVMGCDGYPRVLENLRLLLAERQARRSGVPLIVPVFNKCKENFGEMEAWYDQWIRAVGSAVLRSPSDCGGQIPDVALADMTPSGRKPCARLESRLTILSDGCIVSCEEDVTANQVIGQIGKDSLQDVWQTRVASLREDHFRGEWSKHKTCAKCREWHRP
jgi:radical SAM protein with 4Fe4S-binding SPASM domain